VGIMQSLFGEMKEPDKKFTLVFHKAPKHFSPPELALGMMVSAAVAESKKLGVDPEKVHVVIEFKESGHHLCFTLTTDPKAGGEPMVVSHDAHS
jgi:hypothetical protein